MVKRISNCVCGRQDGSPHPDQPPCSVCVWVAFQMTAEACGGDILQCCRDCEEEEIIPQDSLYDYLETHGGKWGKDVFYYVLEYDCDTPQGLEDHLHSLGVPRYWSD